MFRGMGPWSNVHIHLGGRKFKPEHSFTYLLLPPLQALGQHLSYFLLLTPLDYLFHYIPNPPTATTILSKSQAILDPNPSTTPYFLSCHIHYFFALSSHYFYSCHIKLQSFLH